MDSIREMFVPILIAAFPQLSTVVLEQVLEQWAQEHRTAQDIFFSLGALLGRIERSHRVSKAADFDLAVFPVAIQILRASLWSFLDHHFGRFDVEDRQDAIQEALCTLLEKAPKEVRQHPRKLWRYAEKVAVHYLCREDQYRKRVIFTDAVGPEIYFADRDPEEEAERHIFMTQLHQWVRKRYGEKVWMILELWLQGWTLAEIARRQGVAVATAYRWIQRVLREVRRVEKGTQRGTG